MKEENNIDKLFRKKFEDFSEEPPAFIWDGVREHLTNGYRKKRFAWYGWSAIAVLLVFAFLAGWYFNERSEDLVPQVTEIREIDTDSKQDSGITQSGAENIKEAEGKEKNEPASKFLADADDLRLKEIKNNGKHMISGEKIIGVVTPEEGIVLRQKINPLKVISVVQIKKEPEKNVLNLEKTGEIKAYEKGIINKNATQYALSERTNTEWKMGVNISPGYSSYAAKHDVTYASNMTHESTEGNTNMSGGLSVRYRASSRWSIESGVYYAQNGQQTGSSPQIFGGRAEADFAKAPAEQLYFNTVVSMENSHIALNSTAGVIEIDNMPRGAELSANLENSFAGGNSLITQGDLSQVFDLVEIPLYLRYLVLESKLDVELVGGISAGMIVGNNAFIDNQYGVQKIGKTRDISTLNVSGSVGLGFTYALGKQFSLAMEPRLNYYMNSISRNPEVDFRPYRIGVYTGLYYTF